MHNTDGGADVLVLADEKVNRFEAITRTPGVAGIRRERLAAV